MFGSGVSAGIGIFMVSSSQRRVLATGMAMDLRDRYLIPGLSVALIGGTERVVA